MRYLFNEWDAVKDKINNKYLFIFLDFDGTLASIASSPDKAALSKKAKELLIKLSANRRLKIAFISGRAIGDLKNKVRIKSFIYAGNHGLEIGGPRIDFRPVVPRGYRTALERIKNELERKISSIDGAFVEDKGLSLSLHYRLVNNLRVPLLKTIFHETVILFLVKNRVKIKTGKMVLEVRPPIEWDKGKVVLWLLARQKSALKDKTVFPVYIGDDATDEDAFKALKRKGLTVFVGRPGNSKAGYYLKNTKEVTNFLRLITDMSVSQLCKN